MTSTGQPLDETSARVALAVLRHGPVSRADLCRRLGLSSPTLTRLTGPMVASGLLVEGGPLATSGTGRPSLPLVVAGASGHLVGVKVVPGRLHAVLLDLTATVIDRRTVDGTWSTPEDAVHAIAAVTRDWADRPLKGLGVSLAATVVGEQTSPSELLGWPASPLAGLLRQATGLPVVVDNDVFALTVAEPMMVGQRRRKKRSIPGSQRKGGASCPCGEAASISVGFWTFIMQQASERAGPDPTGRTARWLTAWC